MTRPAVFLLRMLVFLAAVLLLVALLHAQLFEAFAANPLLNGVILCVMGLGIAWNIRQVLMLRQEVDWLEAFQRPRNGAPAKASPRLLAPMASMFASRRSEKFSSPRPPCAVCWMAFPPGSMNRARFRATPPRC